MSQILYIFRDKYIFRGFTPNGVNPLFFHNFKMSYVICASSCLNTLKLFRYGIHTPTSDAASILKRFIASRALGLTRLLLLELAISFSISFSRFGFLDPLLFSADRMEVCRAEKCNFCKLFCRRLPFLPAVSGTRGCAPSGCDDCIFHSALADGPRQRGPRSMQCLQSAT